MLGMKKQKTIWVITGVAILVIIVSLGYLGYKFFTKNDYKSDDNITAQIQTKQQIEADNTAAAKFDEIAQTINDEDKQKTLDLAYEYASDTLNDYLTRLDAYRICIQMAQGLSDTAKKDTCYQDAKKFAETLTVQTAKDDWLKYLDETYNGSVQSDAGDDQSQ
jgi:uncharacterized membrane protein